MNSEDLLSALRLSTNNPEAQRRRCNEALQPYTHVARKAKWAYAHYLRRIHSSHRAPNNFVQKHLEAWADSILYFVNGSQYISAEVPRDLSRMIIAGWHFPEHGLLLSEVAKSDVLVLVASQESWMAPLAQDHALYNFRNTTFSTALPRAMTQGRPVFAMFDHWYHGTRNVVAQFLTYPTHTPIGLLQLGRRFGYAVGFISRRGQKLKLVETMELCGDVEHSAQRLNEILEIEVLRAPTRWLMWPSFPNRWEGVSFD